MTAASKFLNASYLRARYQLPHEAVSELDVRRAKLVTPGFRPPHVDVLLAGEATAFVEIWKRV